MKNYTCNRCNWCSSCRRSFRRHRLCRNPWRNDFNRFTRSWRSNNNWCNNIQRSNLPCKIHCPNGENKDLALIKIQPKRPLQTVSFADSEEVKVGQKVLTIGNPFGFSNTLTQGIISRIDYVKTDFKQMLQLTPDVPEVHY